MLFQLNLVLEFRTFVHLLAPQASVLMIIELPVVTRTCTGARTRAPNPTTWCLYFL